MINREWYEDDTPIDLSKYDGMTEEEIDVEINRIEKEHKEKLSKE